MRLEETALMGIILGVSGLYLGLAPSQVPAGCPVTLPSARPFTPPSPYPEEAPYGRFWHGTDELWTSLERDGLWLGLETDRGRRDKVFWWRPGFDGRLEQRPALAVSGKRLDGEGSFTIPRATNAHHEDFGGWTMLTGVDIPAGGCWEITGTYRDATLSFVVWVPE
jgi:hypothetical protein